MREETKSLSCFFITVLLLSMILWIIGAYTNLMLLPGLPVSSLMAFMPAVSAVICSRVIKTGGSNFKLSEQLRGTISVKGLKWIIASILIQPLIFIFSYLILRIKGSGLPARLTLSPAIVLAVFLFVVAAFTEELGWTGFVLPRLQKRIGWTGSGLAIGIFHALWHVVPFIQAGREPGWIIWQSLFLISARIIIIWLYNRSGFNLLSATMFHATINICWQMFPVNGSYYNPSITGPLSTAAAVCFMLYEMKRRSKPE